MATREQLIEDFADHKYATGEKFERLINSMKVVQEPVTDPAASGTSLSFIDSIEQDADGKITATKKTLDLSNVHELNPFKGWWKTGDTLPTSGFDGAYLYFKDTTQTPAVTTIYRWNGTAYADTGTVVDESNVQTFATGQAVNTVGIDDEPTAESENLVKSGGVYNALLGGSEFISAKEFTEKITNVSAVGNTVVTSFSLRILKNNGYKKIRATVGLYTGTQVNAITFFNGSKLLSDNIIGYVPAILPSSGSDYKTYVADVPDECTFIGVTENPSLTDQWSVEISGFGKLLFNQSINDALSFRKKIVNIFQGYLRFNTGTFSGAVTDFNDGISLYTEVFNVVPGSKIQFKNPNNYLVAYWWFDENNSFISSISTWYTSVGTSVSKEVPVGASKVVLGFRLTAGLDFNTYQPVDIAVEPKKDIQPAIKDFILSEAFLITGNVVKDDNGIISANIKYPDNTTGSFAVTRDSDGNASSVVYVYGSYSYTLSITRDSEGVVTSTSLTENN